MGKINKFCNIYNIDGTLLRKVNEKTQKLDDYTIEELEDLVDLLASDVDENGKVRNPQSLNNANGILLQMYGKYGVPNGSKLLNKLKESMKNDLKTDESEVKDVLEDTDEELTKKEPNYDPEYVDFEEIAA